MKQLVEDEEKLDQKNVLLQKLRAWPFPFGQFTIKIVFPNVNVTETEREISRIKRNLLEYRKQYKEQCVIVNIFQ